MSIGYAGIGGIIGVANNWGEGIEIGNCINYGEIKGVRNLGGIVGTSAGGTIIRNCKNKGKVININVSTSAGGIIALQRGAEIKLINSCNEGAVVGKSAAGGIIGTVSGQSWDSNLSTYINNCYNIGNISAEKVAGGIVGTQDTVAAQNYLYINNSYNAGDVKGKEFGNTLGHIYNNASTDTKTEFTNVYYPSEPSIGTGSLTSGEATLKSGSEIKSQTFVDLLNANIGTNADWKKWKLGTNGYPTFME